MALHFKNHQLLPIVNQSLDNACPPKITIVKLNQKYLEQLNSVAKKNNNNKEVGTTKSERTAGNKKQVQAALVAPASPISWFA